MKKKVILFAGLCAVGLCTCNVWGMTPNATPIVNELTDIPPEYEEIILQGDLILNIAPNAIEAGVNEAEVYIRFNQNFGYVSISLYDGNNNLVYHGSVDTGVQPIVIIPLNDVPCGECYLELNHITGGAEGGFDHNNN